MAQVRGGDKVNAVLAEISKKIGNKKLAVGFLPNATYPAQPGQPGPIYVATIAAIQNYGSPSRGIPARPFFTNMLQKKSPQWGDDLAKVLEATGGDMERALILMGEHISDQLRQEIRDTNAPPLSKLTLFIRKWKMQNPGKAVTGSLVGELAAALRYNPDLSGVSDKPLQDSGEMLKAVDYEVK